MHEQLCAICRGLDCHVPMVAGREVVSRELFRSVWCYGVEGTVGPWVLWQT